MKRPHGPVLLGLGITIAIVAVIAGVMVAGTPGEGRARRFDDIRSGDLRSIMTSVDRFLEREGRLPGSLGELAADPRTNVSIKDPETALTYEYRILDADSYELCALFTLASVPDDRSRRTFWLHDAGRNCFSLDATVKSLGP